MDSTRKDGLVFGFLTQSQANFYASVNGWRNETLKSNVSDEKSTSFDLISYSKSDESNESALSSMSSTNEADIGNKFPVSLAGDFELAVMVLVRTNIGL